MIVTIKNIAFLDSYDNRQQFVEDKYLFCLNILSAETTEVSESWVMVNHG